MALIEGIVKQVVTKPWQDKVFYSVALVNQQGLYGFGPKNPKVNPGDKVRFYSEKNPKGFEQADGKTLEVTPGTEETRSNASSASMGAGSTVGKDTYWTNKEARDLVNDQKREIGAARNTAISFIDLLVKHEAIKLPAGAKREGFLVDLLNDYTEKFTKGIPSKAAAETPAPKAAKAEAESEGNSEDWS